MVHKISTREKQALTAAGAAIVIFIVVQFILFPLAEKQNILKRQVSAAENDIETMTALRAQYTRIQSKSGLSENGLLHNRDFNLFSVLEQCARESGVKQNIAYMKPSSMAQKDKLFNLAMVEMKLESLTLGQLLQFLYQIENAENRIAVNRMALTKTSTPESFINAVLQINALVEQ